MGQDTLDADSLTIKKTRILERRNGRMKISFNLNKLESEAFKNFFTVINQSEMQETEFAKTAFLMGLQTMERAIIARMTEEAEEGQGSEEGDQEVPEIIEGNSEEEVMVDESSKTND